MTHDFRNLTIRSSFKHSLKARCWERKSFTFRQSLLLSGVYLSSLLDAALFISTGPLVSGV